MAEPWTPSSEAEARWRAAERRFRQRMAVTALLLAAGIVLTWALAWLGLRWLAIPCALAVIGGVAWTISLAVGHRRTFLGVMMDDGSSRNAALQEYVRRHGG
jgi:hypothetical protein